MKNRIVKNTGILVAITLVFGLLLGISYEITKEPIARAQLSAKQTAYQVVMPTADTFHEYDAFDVEEVEEILQTANLTNITINEVVIAKQADMELGYVITTTNSNGYGGNITVSVGVTKEGRVTAIQFLTITETAGLGMNATRPAFYEQFEDQQVEAFFLTKGGATNDGEVDCISGATITSNAVVENVNAALVYFENILKGATYE